jgi:hypothetical protein
MYSRIVKNSQKQNQKEIAAQKNCEKDHIRMSRMSVILGMLSNKESSAMIVHTRTQRFKSNKQQIIIHTEM